MSFDNPSLVKLSPAQINKETAINENNKALSPAAKFGYNYLTTSGLTLGVYGGVHNGVFVANQTVTLSASTTNYVYFDNADNTVKKNTTAFPGGDTISLFKVPTNSTTINMDSADFLDYRDVPYGGSSGGGGGYTEFTAAVPSSGSNVLFGDPLVTANNNYIPRLFFRCTGADSGYNYGVGDMIEAKVIGGADGLSNQIQTMPFTMKQSIGLRAYAAAGAVLFYSGDNKYYTLASGTGTWELVLRVQT